MENVEPTAAKTAFCEPTTVLPEAAWRGVLIETAIEVFSMMVGGTAVIPPKDANPPVIAEVTGIIGIAGAMRAIFSLRCSSRSATRIASQMLGASQEEAVKLQSDAIGEVCNIVAGYFKAKIGLGEKCSLSVPTVVVGHDYRVRSPILDEQGKLPLLYENEPIWIALEVKSKDKSIFNAPA